MKNLKKIKLIIGILVFLPIISCSNSNSNNSTTANNNVVVAEANANPTSAAGSVTTEADLEKAKKEGKAVFLIITGKDASDIKSTVAVVKDANAKFKKSVVIQLNRDEFANSGLVMKFGIGAVPVPFILVISPKGVAVAGVQSGQATADMLVKAVPSPKQDDVLFAISEKKPVFIVVSKKTFTDKATTIANCKAASLKVASKPFTVEIDFDDVAEKAFLTQLGISAPVNGKSITVVVNPAGQIAETFTDIPTVEKLVAAANKVIKSGGCAPGACGSGKKC